MLSCPSERIEKVKNTIIIVQNTIFKIRTNSENKGLVAYFVLKYFMLKYFLPIHPKGLQYFTLI